MEYPGKLARVVCSLSYWHVVAFLLLFTASIGALLRMENCGLLLTHAEVQDSQRRTRIACPVQEEPIRIVPFRAPLLDLSREQSDLVWRVARMHPKGKATVSDCLHFLKVQSLRSDLRGSVAATSEVQAVCSVLQNSKSGRDYLGRPVFITTRSGVCMTTGRRSGADESHRDQGIATLAELGIPLSWQLNLDDGSQHFLREAMQECIANFYLKERELAWTTVALSHYVPPTRRWTNRFGEEFTFDDLAMELCNRSFGDQCCSGAHLVHAATILLRSDFEQPVLSPPTRVQLRQYVKRCADAAVRAQRPDGNWEPRWYGELEAVSPHAWSRRGTHESRFLVTSHLAEWMLYLPEDLRVPDATLRSAAEWLLDRLSDGPFEAGSPLCPRAHAVYVLELLSTAPRFSLSTGRPGVSLRISCSAGPLRIVVDRFAV